MRSVTIRQQLRRALALTAAAALAIPAAYATAGTTKIQTSQTLTEGFTYVNTVSDHSAGRMESHSIQLEPDSQVFPIVLQGSETVYGTANINTAVQYAQTLGYNVLGALNSDFFDWNGVPLGISLEQGEYRSSPDGQNALAVVDGEMVLVQQPEITITVTNERTGKQVDIDHFNKWRDSGGGMYLYNEDFSTVSTRTNAAGGRMVRMVLTEEDQDTLFSVNSEITLEVTEVFETEDAVPIGEDNYIMTAAYESGFWDVFSSYQVGDEVTITTSCDNELLSQADWASGCGDILIQNGAITDSSKWTYRTGRDPRTAMGVQADGTMIFYEVDGRQTSLSVGLTEMDLARELLAQGCVWAVNLDGGGSSAMSVRLPGQSKATVVNSPSGGFLRGCATYILLVTEQPEETEQSQAAKLFLQEDGLVVLAGSTVTLGDVAALDENAYTVTSRVADAQFTSQKGLGSFNGSTYTAGSTAGTDQIKIESPSLGISGTATIHVVSQLSDLTVSRQGQTSQVTQLTVDACDQAAFTLTGSYWGRSALRSQAQVGQWSVDGDVGTITSDGVFTPSGQSVSGTIRVTAGGITKSIPVTVKNIHNDVTPDHWAYEAVCYCYSQGVVSGISQYQFGRDNAISRGDFVLMVYNALGRPAVTEKAAFTDVAETDYYADAVAWASAKGLVSGVAEGKFAPKQAITREQAFTILHQALALFDIQDTAADLSLLDQFQDKDLIADYAKPHAAAMVSMGFVSGTGGNINPRGQMSRAEFAMVLYRLMTYDPDSQPEPEPELPPEGATLTLDVTQGELASAQTLQLTAQRSHDVGTVVWSSSDPTVAVVSQTGEVTNVYTGSGSASVVITATWGELTASATIQCGPAQTVGQVVVDTTLNVRSAPSMEGKVIASLRNGNRVVVLDNDTEGWYHVLFADASGSVINGYVSADYLTPLS